MAHRYTRWILIGLSVLLIAMLAACGGSGAPKQAENNENTPVAESDNEKKVDFPTKAIRLVVTHAAGGSVDGVARIIAPAVENALGKPVVVENMEGAGGNIARGHVYKADPDGYTLLISFFPSMIVGELVQDGNFKTLEMTPIAQLTGKASHALFVSGDSEWRTFEDVVEASKKSPLTMAGAGRGSNDHLGFLMYEKAGINMTYVPFDSGAESATALMGGQVDLMVLGTSPQRTPLVLEGKTHPIATAGLEREMDFTEAPTLIELGNEGLGFAATVGIVAPPNVPEDIAKILEKAFLDALEDPNVQEQLKKASYQADPLGAEQFKDALEQNFELVESFKSLLQ